MMRNTGMAALSLIVMAVLAGPAMARPSGPAATEAGAATGAAELERRLAASALELDGLARQLAAVPGSAQSDLVLMMLTGPSGAIVGGIPLSSRPGAPPDATVAALMLSVDRTLPEPLRAASEQALLAAAGSNAWYAVALIDHAHGRRQDPALVAKALRAGAGAGEYRSAYVSLLDDLMARTPPEAGDPAIAPHLRALGIADLFAMPGQGQVAGLYSLCREPAAEARPDCQRLATLVHAGAASVAEALPAAVLLDRLAGSAAPGPRENAMRWLWFQSTAVASQPEAFTAPVSERFVALWRSEGELAARRHLLEHAGIPATPPAGWTQPPPPPPVPAPVVEP